MTILSIMYKEMFYSIKVLFFHVKKFMKVKTILTLPCVAAHFQI